VRRARCGRARFADARVLLFHRLGSTCRCADPIASANLGSRRFASRDMCPNRQYREICVEVVARNPRFSTIAWEAAVAAQVEPSKRDGRGKRGVWC